MQKNHIRILLLLAGAAFIGIGFQNCSNVGFSQNDGAGGDGAQNAAGAPGGDTNGQVPQNGGTNGGPPVTGGPGGTTNPVTVPPGFPPPPPGSTDAPPGAPPGSTFPTGTIPPGTILPKVARGEPPCVRGQWCEYNLTLDKAYDKITDFDWKTNDDQSRVVNNIPAGYVRGQPNTHYVPGSGHVRFLPGELVRKIYVLNINPDPTLKIVIPFIFSKCQYGGANTLCSGMFP